MLFILSGMRVQLKKHVSKNSTTLRKYLGWSCQNFLKSEKDHKSNTIKNRLTYMGDLGTPHNAGAKMLWRQLTCQPIYYSVCIG